MAAEGFQVRRYLAPAGRSRLKIRHVRGPATDISRQLRISGLLSAGAVRKQQADSGVRSAALDFKIHMAVNKIGRDSLQMKSGIGHSVLHQGQVPRQFLVACSLWISSKRNLAKTEPCMNQMGVDTKALHIPIVLRGTNRHQFHYAQLLGLCGGGSAVPLIRRPHSIGWVGPRQATINHKRYVQPVVSMNLLWIWEMLLHLLSRNACGIRTHMFWVASSRALCTSLELKFPDKSKSPLFLPNPKTRSLGTDNEMDQEPACPKDQDGWYRRKLPGIPLCGVEPGIRARTDGARSEEYVQERILESIVKT
ncbi:hypothetical protein EV421DRAFT_1734369 [Armillaria borealis]|uniref:Uncharacterized protein n=1 Tax=Armillaria borealis TaxID=47425 RepID=A0AA39JPP0_9AGAR|nr:hypothetical protein EV421DRAFT_1734369 [Armillaria borealis]